MAKKMIDEFEFGKRDECAYVEFTSGDVPSIRKGKFTIDVTIDGFDCDVFLSVGENEREREFGTILKQRLYDGCFWENFYPLLHDAICDMLTECGA